MADSVDRVFVHALNTVKKIPKTGAARPPSADRMRLYGLYKQAMEGDVDGVMERPNSHSGLTADELRREQDKWDAWNAERGLSRTEAKRRYIETLIETMHTYATTPTAAELVAELEFVWNQIKDNHTPSSAGSYRKDTLYGAPGDSARRRASTAQSQGRASGGYGGYFDGGGNMTVDTLDGPLRVLSPMSEEDEVEREDRIRLIEEELEVAEGGGVVGAEASGQPFGRGDKWFRKMERAMVKLATEVAALRENITAGREFRSRREKAPLAWFGWAFWVLCKHLAADVCLLIFVLLWFRRRKDRRVEDHVRGVLAVLREYARKFLPSR
ncbi:acyl-binding protein family [Grosmannia clavigera kw1407]|uniref:Acyl-binding protein family n=1 Tax=Grosmannia clavigera (strain kw1407 / UAMH 11150) TaxID=655863 RepID=F0XTH9_GROCL|nr:acyl-binding protein family [Grosmannia clavigera kw1407]EFW98867.1 acyl-binding protein family [Grosmannia clavigera kw1407]